MNGAGGDKIAAALVGCTFQTPTSEQEGEDGFPILAVDAGTGQATITMSNGSAAPVHLGRGKVELNRAAADAVDEVRDRLAAPYPDDAKTLRDAGIEAVLGRSDAIIVARALCDQGVPSERQRFDVLDILKHHDLGDQVHALVRQWAEASRPVPLDVAIQLATCQRRAGDAAAARRTIETSMADAPVSRKQLGILLTQHAAVLLDLYEEAGAYADLMKARQSYAEAMTIDPDSGHLARVGARLNSYR